MNTANDRAVSPVVGVMLMLVVTIIIAALVSAFAGNTMTSSGKNPHATLDGVLSQSGGMTITNVGGDVIPVSSIVFTMANDNTFGQSVAGASSQALNMSLLQDSSGRPVILSDGSTYLTGFAPGDSFYVPRDSLYCKTLQPTIYPSDGLKLWDGIQWGYKGSKWGYWALCYTNPDNVGKSFTLTMTDRGTGNVMGKTQVKIVP